MNLSCGLRVVNLSSMLRHGTARGRSRAQQGYVTLCFTCMTEMGYNIHSREIELTVHFPSTHTAQRTVNFPPRPNSTSKQAPRHDTTHTTHNDQTTKKIPPRLSPSIHLQDDYLVVRMRNKEKKKPLTRKPRLVNHSFSSIKPRQDKIRQNKKRQDKDKTRRPRAW